MKFLSLIVPLLLAAVSQDDGKGQAPPPDAKWKAEFKLSLAEKDGKWVFSVEGTTNIPPVIATPRSARIISPASG